MTVQGWMNAASIRLPPWPGDGGWRRVTAGWRGLKALSSMNGACLCGRPCASLPVEAGGSASRSAAPDWSDLHNNGPAAEGNWRTFNLKRRARRVVSWLVSGLTAGLQVARLGMDRSRLSWRRDRWKKPGLFKPVDTEERVTVNLFQAGSRDIYERLIVWRKGEFAAKEK